LPSNGHKSLYALLKNQQWLPSNQNRDTEEAKTGEMKELYIR
jgi:hypothetical protein